MDADDKSLRPAADTPPSAGEAYYRLLTDAMPQTLWRCDRLGECLECNQRWYDYTGQTPAEAKGRGWMKAIHPDDMFSLVDCLRYDPAGGFSYQAEYRLRRASDGAYRWHLARAVPVKTPPAWLECWIGCAIDIDDQKRVEAALRQSEAKHRALLEAIPDQMARVTGDAVYLEVFTPAGFEWVMTAAHVGKHIAEVFPADHAKQMLAAVRSALATGKLQGFEYQMTLPDGRVRDREARIVASGQDEALVLVRDVTDRKGAERALKESEERYRLHFEQASDVIYTLDLDSRFIERIAVGARLTGYRPEELVGRTMQESGLVSPEDLHRLADDKAAVLENGQFTATYRVRAKDGAVRSTEVSGSPLVKGGQIVGGIMVARDITDRKQAEDALRQLNADLEARVRNRTADLEEANRRLRAMASEVLLAEERERRRLAVDLHDAPAQALMVAKMRLARLRADDTGGQAASGTRQQALGELADLIDQAHDAIRSLTFQLSPPILYDLGLAPALDWLATDFQERYQLEVTVEGDGQSAPIPEPARIILYRCVRELLMNVVKHSGAREARIELGLGGGAVSVTVADEGKGFALPASPAEPNAAGKPGGGFGLFSIRERLANIGGRMTIVSSPGAGTAVTMEAPL